MSVKKWKGGTAWWWLELKRKVCERKYKKKKKMVNVKTLKNIKQVGRNNLILKEERNERMKK